LQLQTSLRWFGGAQGPLWRGARLEEIGQIGLKPAVITKYQDNKNHPKFIQTAKYCRRSFSLSS